MAGRERSPGEGGRGGGGRLKENRNDEDGDDVDDFDHWIDGWACRVLVGIADGVAGHGGGVGEGAFAATVAFFNIFFCVVPGTAGGSHGDGDKKSGDDGADENAPKHNGSEARNGGNSDNKSDGKKGGDDHLAESGPCHDIDAGSIVGLIIAEEDSRSGGELAPNFTDYGTRGNADGIHRAGGEDEGKESADEEADNDLGFGEGEFEAGHSRTQGKEVGFQLLNVASEKYKRGKTCGGDRIAFGHRFHGVADGVEFIGPLANRFGHARHHSDSSRVIRDRSECIEGDDDSGHGEHRHDGNGNAVEAGEVVAKENGDPDEADGESRGVGADGQACDDVRGVSGLRGFRDIPNGRIVGGCVVVRDQQDDERHKESDERGEVDAESGGDLAVVAETVWKKDLGEGPKGGGRGEGTEEDAEAEEAGGIATSEIHCEDAKDGRENGDSAYDEGVTEGGGFGFAIATEDGEVGDENTPDQADGVSFKDICGHSGTVSHVVSDVVGDGSGIAGVIFFEFRFDFAHEVGSDVGSFGVDAASETCKHADEGSTEGEAGETVDGGAEAEIFAGNHIEGSDREKGQSDDEQAGDGSAIERVA